jgi:hypothetical protein
MFLREIENTNKQQDYFFVLTVFHCDAIKVVNKKHSTDAL